MARLKEDGTGTLFRRNRYHGSASGLGVSYPRVNELVHGKRGVTPDTALRLERLFGMEAQFWLNLQLAWDLYQVEHSPAARAIRHIRRLSRAGLSMLRTIV